MSSPTSAKEHVDIVFEEITHEIHNGGEVRMEHPPQNFVKPAGPYSVAMTRRPCSAR